MFDIKYHLKTNMSKMKLNLDESYEEYTTEELQLLDKFQEYSGNIFDDQEIYDVIVNCKFDEEKIKDEINLMMKDAQRGDDYKWHTIEKKNDKDKKTTTKTKTNAVRGKKEKKYEDVKESAQYKANGSKNNYYKTTSSYARNNNGYYNNNYYNNTYYNANNAYYKRNYGFNGNGNANYGNYKSNYYNRKKGKVVEVEVTEAIPRNNFKVNKYRTKGLVAVEVPDEIQFNINKEQQQQDKIIETVPLNETPNQVIEPEIETEIEYEKQQQQEQQEQQQHVIENMPSEIVEPITKESNIEKEEENIITTTIPTVDKDKDEQIKPEESTTTNTKKPETFEVFTNTFFSFVSDNKKETPVNPKQPQTEQSKKEVKNQIQTTPPQMLGNAYPTYPPGNYPYYQGPFYPPPYMYNTMMMNQQQQVQSEHGMDSRGQAPPQMMMMNMYPYPMFYGTPEQTQRYYMGMNMK